MAYTGDLNDPIQLVRHIIGDVDGDPLFTDAEITYELGVAGDDAGAAAVALCHRAMARYAQLVTTADGELRVEASKFFEHYQVLAQNLDTSGGGGVDTSATPFAGGISVADRLNRVQDRGRMTPFFDRELPSDSNSRWGP